MKLAAGQVAVVTGGASGIGFGMAEAFAQRGLDLVIADVRPDAIDEATAKLRQHGVRVLGATVDVRDLAQVEELAQRTVGELGRVDVVCNNAGVVGPIAPSWELDLSVWRWMIDVMLFGVIHGIRAFVPRLIAQGHGHVVNTASVGGLIELPMLAPYAAAKHAVVGLTEALAKELSQTGNTNVGASVLCPGLVATALGESSMQNRPADLVVHESAPRQLMVDPSALMPADVGPIVVAGIEADKLHIFTHESTNAGVRGRVERLLADLP